MKLKAILLTLSEYTSEQQYQVRANSNTQTLLPKETVNQNATKCALLADETATTSGDEHVASPPKVSTVKEIPKRAKKLHQNWLLKRVIPQKASALSDEGAMASDSDLDGEDILYC